MVKIIKHRSPEWYTARIGKITASNLSELMAKPADKSDGWSKSALTYIKDLALQICTNQFIERPDSDATRWGIRNEPYAIEAFQHHTGYLIKEAGFILHPDHEDIGATPDCFVIEDKSILEVCIAQIKCPYNGLNHLKYGEKIKDTETLRKSRSAYFWQMQGEMWVTGAKYGYFVSYDPRVTPNQQIIYTKILRVDEAIEQLANITEAALELRDKYVAEYRSMR